MLQRSTDRNETAWLLLVEQAHEFEVMALRAHRSSGRPERLVVARGAGEAMLALEYGDAPAMIILENDLGDVRGMELLASLKSDPVLKGVPIVMLTGSADPEDVREAYRLGASCYVCKPIDFAAYGRLVNTIMGLWLPTIQTMERQGIRLVG